MYIRKFGIIWHNMFIILKTNSPWWN